MEKTQEERIEKKQSKQSKNCNNKLWNTKGMFIDLTNIR